MVAAGWLIEAGRVVAKAEVSPSAKAVLGALVRYADWRTGERCFPSVASLSADTGLSERTVYRALAELETERYVDRDAHPRRTTRYTIHLDRQGRGKAKPATEATIEEVAREPVTAAQVVATEEVEVKQGQGQEQAGESLADFCADLWRRGFEYYDRPAPSPARLADMGALHQELAGAAPREDHESFIREWVDDLCASRMSHGAILARVVSDLKAGLVVHCKAAARRRADMERDTEVEARVERKATALHGFDDDDDRFEESAALQARAAAIRLERERTILLDREAERAAYDAWRKEILSTVAARAALEEVEK